MKSILHAVTQLYLRCRAGAAEDAAPAAEGGEDAAAGQGMDTD